MGMANVHAANTEEVSLTYDRIDLTASASGDAPNDMLVAVLFRQLEGAAAAPLANEVNQAIAKALQRAQQIPAIAVQTLDYRTEPVYQKDRVSGWRVRQSLRLESRDATVLGSLLGELQRDLSLESIAYQVSPERMREVEDRLIAAALKAFQQRADLVTRELGRSRYRIVTLRVETGNASPRPVYANGRGMIMESAAPPPIAAGQQPVAVTVNGVIELQSP
jgi:predicted secreted protein